MFLISSIRISKAKSNFNYIAWLRAYRMQVELKTVLLRNFRFDPIQTESLAEVREHARAALRQQVSSQYEPENDFDYLFYVAEIVNSSLNVMRCGQKFSSRYMNEKSESICFDMGVAPFEWLDAISMSKVMASVIDMILKCASIELRLPEIVTSSERPREAFMGDVTIYIALDPDVFYVPTMEFVDASLSSDTGAADIQRAWQKLIREIFQVLDEHIYSPEKPEFIAQSISAIKTPSKSDVIDQPEIDLCNSASARIRAKLNVLGALPNRFPAERKRLQTRLDYYVDRVSCLQQQAEARLA